MIGSVMRSRGGDANSKTCGYSGGTVTPEHFFIVYLARAADSAARVLGTGRRVGEGALSEEHAMSKTATAVPRKPLSLVLLTIVLSGCSATATATASPCSNGVADDGND